MAGKWTGIAEAFPPGEFVREELEFRGWTQQQLADQMKRPVQVVNMIVNGRKAITAETALQLQKAFGPSAAYWMGLESDWQLYKEAQKQDANNRRKENRAAHKAESSSAEPLRTETAMRDRSSAKNRTMLPPGVPGQRMAAKAQVASVLSQVDANLARKSKPTGITKAELAEALKDEAIRGKIREHRESAEGTIATKPKVRKLSPK